MAISDKTRKMLWAKSGNLCAICRAELLHEEQQGKSLNIGEECHIISQRLNGPRHSKINGYDEYHNLILLCRNHHIEIDTHELKYTESELQKIKKNHENWLKKAIDQALRKQVKKKPLVIVTTGKQLADIISSATASRTYHDELRNPQEAELIGGFLDLVKEYIEVIDSMTMVDIANMSLSLKEQMNELVSAGYLVFAASTKETFGDGIIFNVANVHVIRKDNPMIQKVGSDDIK